MKSEWIEEAHARLRHDDGRLLWRVGATFVKSHAGKEAGWIARNGYRYVTIGGKGRLVHRVIWEMVNGEAPEGMLDHMDGNPLNNEISNLREADHALNAQNLRRFKKGNSSGYLGVHFNKSIGKFVASIMINRRAVHLGCFVDPAKGYEAYLNAKRALHAGCTL